MGSDAYWVSSGPTGTLHYQQPPPHAITSVTGQYPPDAQGLYHNQIYEEGSARQSFSGVPAVHADHHFHNHDFSQNERRMTMPANIYGQAGDPNMNIQTSPPITQGQGSYAYNQKFLSQFAQNPQGGNWFPAPMPQQGFQQQNPTSQRNPYPKLPSTPGWEYFSQATVCPSQMIPLFKRTLRSDLTASSL